MATADVVAVLSPGQMGHAVGRVLAQHGLRVITSLAGRSQHTAELSQAAGIDDVGSLDQVASQADTILSIMPSAAAPVVAGEVASRLPKREKPLLFVECNAIAPQTMRGIESIISGAGGLVVDVGIIGGPPSDTYQPRLYASGPDVDRFTVFNSRGLDVRPIGAEIGQASGMKMCYAALTKGMSALGTELMLAAAKLGLIEPLHDELRGSQPALFEWLESGIPGMPPKSRRWVSEMEEIAATLGHLGLSSGYHLAAADLFRWVGETSLAQERPESRDHSRSMSAAVEELAASIVTFEDLATLDDRAIQRVVRDVNRKDLAMALQGATDELKRKIYKCMSSRAAQLLKEDLSVMGTVRQRVADESRRNIVSTVRALREAGEIATSA